MSTEPNTPSPDTPNSEGEVTTDTEQTFAQKFAAMFKPAQKDAAASFSIMEDAMLKLAGKVTELETDFSTSKKENAALDKKVTAQADEITKLNAALAAEPAPGDPRPAATGANENLTEF